MKHFNIDMEKTGAKLKYLIKAAGYDVKYIQKYLHLSCPQPVYRWFKGKVMPSLEHLYALSVLLGMHMEELLVMKNEINGIEFYKSDESGRIKRIYEYYRRIHKERLLQKVFE